MLGGIEAGLLCLTALATLATTSQNIAGIELSKSPRILLYEDFLLDSECAALIKQAESSLKFDDHVMYNSIYLKKTNTSEAAENVENRIAALTNVPRHADEEPMNVHRILPSAASASMANVHHDKVHKPFSTVTVLMYLSDQVEEGGELVFPCTAGEDVEHACESAFHGGARWFNRRRTIIEGTIGFTPRTTSVHDALQQVWSSANDSCADSSAGSTVRVTPKKRSAVVFYHDESDGTPAPGAWHSACGLRRGVKWTAQKFKELPLGGRKEYKSIKWEKGGTFKL
jgi:hypothetical protein